ncbi:TPA: hypothetical protein N0F65_010634 [Lagenidium giganteum]|uniref:Uncharacterized protein n=1 Tax=Lagenidium giganteum TaxID=4803 RepID=A0AAV2ZCG2_9STRA|nr:TPA: hypothetical protein N0F65_010634 [Lagenidium giganteum]
MPALCMSYGTTELHGCNVSEFSGALPTCISQSAIVTSSIHVPPCECTLALQHPKWLQTVGLDNPHGCLQQGR